MGSMIDSAEKDPQLGLLHINEINGMDVQNGEGQRNNIMRSGTGGGSMIRGAHNNTSYTGWGSSGESTGGSARHYWPFFNFTQFLSNLNLIIDSNG